MTAKTKPAAKPTPAPAAKAKKSAPASTTFSIHAPQASQVWVAGDFNAWQPDDLKARRFKDGTWRKSLTIKPGTYQYLFLVDGQWCPDPENPLRVANPFGSENSVITVA